MNTHHVLGPGRRAPLDFIQEWIRSSRCHDVQFDPTSMVVEVWRHSDSLGGSEAIDEARARQEMNLRFRCRTNNLPTNQATCGFRGGHSGHRTNYTPYLTHLKNQSGQADTETKPAFGLTTAFYIQLYLPAGQN